MKNKDQIGMSSRCFLNLTAPIRVKLSAQRETSNRWNLHEKFQFTQFRFKIDRGKIQELIVRLILYLHKSDTKEYRNTCKI